MFFWDGSPKKMDILKQYSFNTEIGDQLSMANKDFFSVLRFFFDFIQFFSFDVHNIILITHIYFSLSSSLNYSGLALIE